MTQTNNRFLDDLAKLMTDAAGAAQGMRRDFDTMVLSQGERMLRELDVVQREEFEAVKEMAAKAREQNEQLAARVGALRTVADITHGKAFTEAQFDSVVRASRDAVGRAQAHTLVAGYARIPLAPWLILAAAVPLAFLLWRRNA